VEEKAYFQFKKIIGPNKLKSSLTDKKIFVYISKMHYIYSVIEMKA